MSYLMPGQLLFDRQKAILLGIWMAVIFSCGTIASKLRLGCHVTIEGIISKAYIGKGPQ